MQLELRSPFISVLNALNKQRTRFHRLRLPVYVWCLRSWYHPYIARLGIKVFLALSEMLVRFQLVCCGHWWIFLDIYWPSVFSLKLWFLNPLYQMCKFYVLCWTEFWLILFCTPLGQSWRTANIGLPKLLFIALFVAMCHPTAWK